MDSSFDDVELSTILTILDQDALNIESELNLFCALNRYAEKHGLTSQNRKMKYKTENHMIIIHTLSFRKRY